VTLQADAEVTSIRLLLDGNAVANLTARPWEAAVDFGHGIQPHELIAVGFDATGAEIARATQPINVPRPSAEVEILVNGMTVELRWRHLMNEKPRKAALKLDDAPLRVDRYRAQLRPSSNLTRPHVLAAELLFSDVVARRERVVGGHCPTRPARS
jgi:hypothetical protein